MDQSTFIVIESLKSVLIEYSSSRSCVVSSSALLDASESVWADMKDKSKERNRTFCFY